ncbi:MAG: right-handed parallel beta-helix repeat-containing protein [Pseudomonadota bacterium]
MRKTGLSLVLFGLLAVLSLPTTSAQAQATRTWVSGVGDDANPCSRTAPCKTFAGAISKTAAGGEIDCLDPGGFGAVTITKSMTIDCTGVTGGVLNALSNGVIVNAAAADKIVLRNLNIQGTSGANIGINGIRFLAGKELQLVRVTILGASNFCVDVNKAAVGILYVNNSFFSECLTGINITTTNTVVAVINNSTFNGIPGSGVTAASAGVFANVANSTFVNGGSGVLASASGAIVNASNNVIANNTTGINASVSGASIRASSNQLYDNGNAFNVAAGATFLTGNDNKVSGNAGSASTGTMTTK